MTTVHRLSEERSRFFSDLRYNKNRFIDFLGAMAKHYRHPISTQVGLFFHGNAASEAYAPAATWAYLNADLRDDARGVPVLSNEAAKDELHYFYDMSDTRDSARQRLEALIWRYDDARDGAFLRAQLGAEGKETAAAVVDTCRTLAESRTDAKEREIVPLGAAYVTLSRLGFDAEDVVGLPLILTEYNDVDAEKTLMEIRAIAQEVLNPVARHIREEARHHAKEHDPAGRTHPSMADAGESVGDRRGEGTGTGSALGRTSGEEGERTVEGVLSSGGGAGISRGLSGDDADPATPVGEAAEGDVTKTHRADDGVPEVLGGFGRGRSVEGSGASDEGVESSPVGGTGRESQGEERGGERAARVRDVGESIQGGGRGGAAELAPVDLSAIDYAADMSSTRGKRAVFARNLAAIRVMKHLEERVIPPTSEELRLLRSYSGFGGILEAFDPANKAWSKEYDALRRHLTEAEFSSARASTLNAHYTPPEVIAGIYEGLAHIGFTGGNVLEPSCGAGRFFDAMPEEMRNESRLFGVEVDVLSARIARLAHLDAEIAQQGFERTRFADGSFDLAISNVPFGDEIITGDPKYLGERLRIHDYFLNKMIDEVRPGGLVVAITSKGTMDKSKERVRSMLADKARLVTALRLLETAFSAAGTRVISDLLVFRKKDPARSPTEEQQDALAAVDWDGVLYQRAAGENINKYFYHNPEQVLGEFATRSGAYGREQTVVAPEGQNLGAAIRERLTALPTGIYTPTPETLPIPVQEQREQRASMGFYVEDGELCFVNTEGARSVPEMTDKDRARVISAVHLRDAGHALLSAQQEECSNEELYALQKKLTERYEDHVRRYGRIVQDKTLKKLFGVDPGSNFIAAYEIYDSKKNFIRKADIFTERTIVPQRVPTEAESAADALTISMQQKGGVDLSYMAGLTGKPASDLAHELEFKQIFYDEAAGYVQADAYLSGDIRGKMEDLEKRRAAIEKELAEGSNVEASPEERAALEAQLFRVQKNYAALEEVKPKDLEIGDISCGLGVSWLPTRYIEQFIEEKFQPEWSAAVAYSPETGEWQVKHPADARRNPATMRWGTKEKDAYELLSGALNFRTPVVYVPTDDDKKKIVDREKTIAAQMKQQEIKDAFQEWLIQDTQRVQFITDYYNRNFNNIRPREYSGAHLHFPGMSNSISLNAHQKDAVAHSLYGGSTLFAHCVGAGKTFEMVASIMEAKRLGISQKLSHFDAWAANFGEITVGMELRKR